MVTAPNEGKPCKGDLLTGGRERHLTGGSPGAAAVPPTTSQNKPRVGNKTELKLPRTGLSGRQVRHLRRRLRDTGLRVDQNPARRLVEKAEQITLRRLVPR